jgi:hypothetical protein
MEKSLLVELDYVRRLEEMSRNADEILGNNATGKESCSDETTRCDENPYGNETAHHIDHAYDYDRVIEEGFSRMYSDLVCSVHARDQDKPMYTPEMWRTLCDIFRDSTSFPFPIPDAREQLPEGPSFRADRNRGRKGTGRLRVERHRQRLLGPSRSSQHRILREFGVVASFCVIVAENVRLRYVLLSVISSM